MSALFKYRYMHDVEYVYPNSFIELYMKIDNL